MQRLNWEARRGCLIYIDPMTPKPFSWDRSEARTGKFNGKFIIGVHTTGIYCLLSCTARQPKPENVSIYRTEAEAQAAGLRACKRCRPDLFYKGEDENIALFEGLADRVRANLLGHSDTSDLARACGVSQPKLGELFREHAHLTPAAWLRRERVRAASQALLAADDKIVDVGFGAGFESESAFHRQFLALSRMTPGAYRALNGAAVFLLQLPSGYRAAEVLAYHARDPEGLCERSEGNQIWKALTTPDGAVVLELALEREGAWCRVHADKKMGRESMTQLHAVALKMLGLNNEVSLFETRMGRETRTAPMIGRQRGLRLPCIPTNFDGLCWAVIGQQINVKFAGSLRREIIALGGEKVGAMVAHPTPERVLDIGAAALTKRRYSRSKAEYLMGVASAVVENGLDVEGLSDRSAVAAEKKLTAIRGVGTWTARYFMLRGGFADAAPVGDSALATALQKLYGLPERPGHDDVHKMMLDFAPYRSLATMHLWTSLKAAA